MSIGRPVGRPTWSTWAQGLGAQSQKTSFLGGVVQILIFQRPSPCLADVRLCVRPKSQQSSLEQRSPCKLNFLHNGKSNVRSRSNSSVHGADTPYVKHQLQPTTPLYRVEMRHAYYKGAPLPKYPVEPNCIIEAYYYAFLRQIGGQQHQTSPTYLTKFGAWL